MITPAAMFCLCRICCLNVFGSLLLQQILTLYTNTPCTPKNITSTHCAPLNTVLPHTVSLKILKYTLLPKDTQIYYTLSRY